MKPKAPSFLVALSKPKPSDRYSFVWNGVTIRRTFARRPRIHRLEASRPKGCGVGENPLHFPSSVDMGLEFE